MPIRSTMVRRSLLALVGGPLAVAALLLAGELLCRVVTPADSPLAPARYFDRRVEGGRELLVPSPSPPMANARFWPASIPIGKPPGTHRLLCVGDSTVHGHPFEPPAAFADWLAVRLPHLIDGSRFDVVNLGANGMNAEAVLDLVGELAPLLPEVVVVYVGHNEFLDSWLDASCRPLAHSVERAIARSWLLRRVTSWLPAPPPRPSLAARSPARPLLEEAPLLSPAEFARGIRNFSANLDAIARAIVAMGAVPVLCAPVCDVVDTAPEWSTIHAPLAPAARQGLRDAVAQLHERRLDLDARRAVDPEADVAAEARALVAEADRLLAQDAQLALLHYERGRLLRRLGESDAALLEFFAARDLDDHPIRAPAALLEGVRHACARTGALLVDPWPEFSRAARDGLPGRDGFFVDYVHPDLTGHRWIAEAILRELAQRGLFAPTAKWRFAAEPPAAEYESAMGLSRERLADSLARRGLFALGQGYLDPASVEPLRAAEDLFTTALSVHPECAMAHAGRGALALVRGQAERALAGFDRAHALDPSSLTTFVENYEKIATVRELFTRAGLTVREGRIERLPAPR